MDFSSEDLWDLDDSHDLLGSEEDWVDRKKLPQLGSVKNFDYNLNNPLLDDELLAFSAYLRNQSYDKIFENQYWSRTRNVIGYERIPYNHDLTAIHRWFGGYLLQSGGSTLVASEFINLVISQSQRTHIVVSTFLQSLTKESVSFLPRCATFVERELLAKFLDWHCLTLVLNHFYDDLSPISGLVSLRKMNHPDYHWFRAELSTGLNVVITPWLVLTSSGLPLTRNLVLMIKDVLLARFQTLITMYPRHDMKFSSNDVQTLLEVYKLGDRMLSVLGNKAYDHIKFLEPICNLRMTQLANDYRPLIPEFPKFRIYLEGEVGEISRENPLISQLYDKIMMLEKVELVIQIFGCFRHWGHPFIDYFDGLAKLYDQVTMAKDIDDTLAQALGSDLAYLVLRMQFKKTKKWFVNGAELPQNHPLKTHVDNATWPTPKVIEDFGDNWHNLPLLPCFEIPDLVDPSLIYSDKSHSVYRSELLNHVRTSPHKRFPTKRVLSTFLEKPARDWKTFLQQIEESGLPSDCLCIGLRPKERELKRSGRFFALMSWELREYFVFTEYLIKEHYIPLFKGLTMADDMTGVIKKLLENSNGHGEEDYQHITISNHLDYSKWNNHQRLDSNKYVFRVMGCFLGFPRLIERTHEFFQKSLIYFINRPDLMRIEGDTLGNKTSARVCWQGQPGGLEGLRQKGWSILNLLLILRIAKMRNTEIKILAQGDNQVLNMHYQLPTHRSDLELLECINEVVRNNNFIMTEVDNWTKRLGLIINQDETMQSADFLIYGKIPIFRGNISLPESKRWSRVNCVTNDQLPTFANVLSTVSSTALTVSHFSSSIVDPIELYNLLGNFARVLLELYDPVLNKSLLQIFPRRSNFESLEYMLTALYLDPSLGGICGMSLTRFLIRAFPDPVTEGLSFWKGLGISTEDPVLRSLALKIGDPNLGRFKVDDLVKLMEKPESLNIPSSLSAQILIRTEIRNILRRNVRLIKNEIISNAIVYGMQAEEHLIRFLFSIKPLFPRFLAEFKASTYLGLTESLVGLYENSKTIRNKFLGEREREIDGLIQKSEIHGVQHLMSFSTKSTPGHFWDCSASLADRLRHRSWGQPVLGATVPHPYEMLSQGSTLGELSKCCQGGRGDYLTTFADFNPAHLLSRKGPYLPYLGSKTSESTSLITPWEKETIVPLIKRAARLRNTINWFVLPESNLGKSILNNLRALTGEDPGTGNPGFMRTGSALHRFASARQSSGGFSALSPAFLSRFLTTTDTLTDIGDKNYDFMFQSLILFAQSSLSGYINHGIKGVIHHHIACKKCLREIVEPVLESPFEYNPKDVSVHIRKWIPGEGAIFTNRTRLELVRGEWDMLSPNEQSYHVGRAVGFVFTDFVYSGSLSVEDSSLFPLSIRFGLYPPMFYEGILDGIIRGCSIHITHRRNVALLKKPRETLTGSVFFVITKLSLQSQFVSLIRTGPLHNHLLASSHKTPPSYPLSRWDLGSIARHYLKSLFLFLTAKPYLSRYNQLWIFADLVSIDVAGPLCLSSKLLKYISSPHKSKIGVNRLREYKMIEISMRQKEEFDTSLLDLNQARLCNSEVRHSVKCIKLPEELSILPTLSFSKETTGWVRCVKVEYLSVESKLELSPVEVPRIQCPLISGLRTVQIATGAHYKVRSLLVHFKINYRDFLCGGDGSGGLTSMCLRFNKLCRGIFNSLLELTGYDMRGSKPSEPSALTALGIDRQRCINYTNCWENPSDLTNNATWSYFIELKKTHSLDIQLMIFDMENRDDQSSSIEYLLAKHLPSLLSKGGTVIFKSYVHRLLNTGARNPMILIGKYFRYTYCCQTQFTSSHSSEVYLVFLHYTQTHSDVRYLDEIVLRRFLTSTCVFGTERAELDRAISLLPLDLEMGVPSELLPNPEVDLSTALEIAGLESGKAAVLSDMINKLECPLQEKYLITLGVISNSFFNLTAEFIESPAIPSDSKLLKFFSFWLGLEYWWAWISNDLTRYSRLNFFIRNDLIINQYTKRGSRGWRRFVRVGYWKEGKSKRLRLQGHLSGVGASIRCLVRATSRQRGNRPISLERVYKRFDQNLSPSLLESQTNFLSYLVVQTTVSSLPVSSEVVNSGRTEVCALRD
ncbi:RNA-dependent RNA polymerase [Wufeng Rhinolophus pearsonii tupavirus 1]|uniref:Replicase n=1 Tax=Wufeng Rhinolophus pearsonii tupavirus 1 TaxID=2877511 RepID=A0AAX2ZE86_9RHAB|nr:RNA-dependent RNA polymerase [Wufeng Rhinolophus pearsonii tupavirus 1]UBB42393.1 RNA-dependent RNA polymerase [Wufeng Rhinolophus pearsonii tupavirus 1]